MSGIPWSSRLRGQYVVNSDDEDELYDIVPLDSTGIPWSVRVNGSYVLNSHDQDSGDEDEPQPEGPAPDLVGLHHLTEPVAASLLSGLVVGVPWSSRRHGTYVVESDDESDEYDDEAQPDAAPEYQEVQTVNLSVSLVAQSLPAENQAEDEGLHRFTCMSRVFSSPPAKKEAEDEGLQRFTRMSQVYSV